MQDDLDRWASEGGFIPPERGQLLTPIEIYASVILHAGCGVLGERHKWTNCPHQKFYLRIARKQQHRLQSNGITIGKWLKKKEANELLIAVRERKGDYLAWLESFFNDIPDGS